LTERHKWGDPLRREHHTDRMCTRCGLVKRTRHEPDARPMHWTEWWTGETRLEATNTPKCQPAEVDA
jgi:hypothetical protein